MNANGTKVLIFPYGFPACHGENRLVFHYSSYDVILVKGSKRAASLTINLSIDK